MTGKEIFNKYFNKRIGNNYKPDTLFDSDFLDLLYEDAKKDGIKYEDWGPINMQAQKVFGKLDNETNSCYRVYKLLD